MTTKTYARIANDVVAELVTLDASLNVTEVFNLALVFVNVTNVSPMPQQGWTYTAPSTFTPPSPPSITLAQSAQIAATSGLAVTLSGTLSLAETVFPTDVATQAKLNAVVTTINTTGTFPGGGTTYPMKDAGGAWHIFTLSQYEAMAGAIAAFVAANDLIADGNPLGATELPANRISLTV